VDILKKYIRIMSLAFIVIVNILLWFVPIRSEDLQAGCSAKMNYYNIYGRRIYYDVMFSECLSEGQQQSSIYNDVLWHGDVLGRFHGVVDGKEIVFGSFDELQTAVLNDGKNEYGFAHGFDGIYYWDEVEQRWMRPSATIERREAAEKRWRYHLYMPWVPGTK
jgi:hypothetical protein